MEQPNEVDKTSIKTEFTSIRSDLTEKHNDSNLCIISNEKEAYTVNTSDAQTIELERDYISRVDPIQLEKDQLSMIVNTSSDNFLTSTAAENSYLSEDDEFDLQKIKQEALHINFSSNFKNENSLDLDYDCADLNISTSFEINTNSIQHSDMFIHEEVFSDNFDEIYLHPNEGVPLDIEMCKKNTHDDVEEINISSVLSDHNYMGQEVNIIRPELSIKSLNDLKNYSVILNRFIVDYEKSSELKSTETEKLIEEISEKLNIFKNSIKINNDMKSIINVENKDNKCTLNDNIFINENIKSIDNYDSEKITTPYSEVEMESLILSENCSEPFEFRNNLLGVDNLKNDLNEIENSKVEKNDDDDTSLLNQICKFGLNLVDSCKKINSSQNENVKDFFSEKLSEFKQILVFDTNTVSVQTDYSGKIYSEKRLKKFNDNEKYRLLKDSSSSHITSSDDEYGSESCFSMDSNEQTKSDNESNNSYNGIDLSQYIEKPLIKEIDSSSIKSATDITENCNSFSEEHSDSVLNGVNIENKEEDKDEIEDKEINRLLDFKSLANKKVSLIQYTYNDVEKSPNCAKNKSEKLLQMLEYSKIDELSEASCSDVEDNLATEKEFLVKRNEDLKRSLLDTSSSDSDGCSEGITLEKENNDSNTSLVLKFLETYETENDHENENNNNSLSYENISNHFKDAEIEINNNNVLELETQNEENKIEKSPEIEKNSIFDKAFIKKVTKEKTFESLLTEDERRRKYLKYNEELISLSSEESEVEENKADNVQHSRILRPMMRQDQLASETKVAQKEENNRILRLKNKENILKKAFKEHKIDRSNKKELILDYNLKTKNFIKVHPDLFKQLKQHQIEGIKFMYDACYGSVNFTNEHPGSGCILAHCMGLGKTLQLIALLHTVICNKELKTSRVLVLCPKSTVMNWADEIQRWLAPLKTKNIKIFTFNDTSDIKNKLSILREWASSGKPGFRDSGCLLIGYEAFRTLVSYHTYRKRSSYLTQLDIDAIQKTVKETLLQPGADLVVCDEGHIIKNRKAAISQAVTEISTRRRIVLTGTPIQNNLKEYYSMVNFIKPSFLGTEKEFANLYANPIRYGQHKDSSKRDIKIMKQRSFVLHKKLSSFVQRREAALLKTFLPPKFEYVLFIPLSKVQSQLYEIFLESVSKRDDCKGRSLLTDYTCLRKIWTHPKVLENAWLNATMLKQKKEKRNTNLIIQSDDEEPDDIYDSQTGLMSVTSDWWRSHLTKQDLESIIPSNKLQAMFEILKMCAESREKCLIFSAFVAVLNVVEYFMQLINNKEYSTPNEELGIERFKGPWINGKDYYRLDGKTPKTLRHEMVKSFNNPENDRARVFLISAKAGGQGINLTGANRVLILDTSWNPSNDQQNIFRIFRLGQTRNCYIYRLISLGTMEEKVYSRSVTKQAMSFRVVDEHQIDRHYSMAELGELYTLTSYGERPVPFLPQDNILANLLRNHANLVYKYHEHDSLLENKIEQELSEQEKEDAWLAYERDTNYNAAVTEGILPQLGRFDVYGNQTFIPPMEYGTNNNLPEMSFNQRSIAQHPPQSPFLSNYGYPANESYLDSIYKMYQNAQNYSSSMLGMDTMNQQCGSNTNTRIGISTNTSNTLANFRNTLSPFGNTQNIPTEMTSINPSHYGTSIYSPPPLTQYSHSSLMDNLKKTIENYSSSNTGLRIQNAQTTAIQSNNPFQSSFITNDATGLSDITAHPDAIPTSVIMKNDLLLKQFNDQIKSAAGSNNRYNLINKSNILRPVLKSGKSDNVNCISSDNISLVKAKKKKTNEKKDLLSAANQNYTSLARTEKPLIAYKSNISSSSTYITGQKQNVTESKDKNEEENSMIAKSSGIFLIENQPITTSNKPIDQTAAVDNISTLSNSISNTKTNALAKSNSLTIKHKTKPHIEVTNNNFVSPNQRNSEIQTTLNNAQNVSKSSKFNIAVESQHPPGSIQESNLKIRSIPKLNQPKQTTNNDKTNNILPFNTSINQNVVITKVHDTKGKSNLPLPSQNISAKTKINSNLIQTGKDTFRNATASNLMKGNDKSIVNKFLNSDLSITPARKRISNTSVINQIQQMPQIENVTSQLAKQQDQRKRASSNLQQSVNFTSENQLNKRQKLTSASKTEVYNRMQNNYKL